MELMKTVVSVLVLSAAFSAFSADCVWIGGGEDANWSTEANWEGGLRPTADDSVKFDSKFKSETADIVVDSSSSETAPAANSMWLATGQSAKISGGQTLFVKYTATDKEYKLTEGNGSSLEITGSGTKAYFTVNLPTNNKSFTRCNGDGVTASDGAYVEIQAAAFQLLQAKGADENGVRSKIVFGPGQNSYCAGTVIADGADAVWTAYSTGNKKEWSYNNAYQPTVIARNGGTNDLSIVNWGNRSFPTLIADSKGVIKISGYAPNDTNDEYGQFAITNAEIYVGGANKGFQPGYNASQTRINMGGVAPVLICADNKATFLGKSGAGSVAFDLQPTVEWANLPQGSLIVDKCTSSKVTIGNVSVNIDMGGLQDWIKESKADTLKFKLVEGAYGVNKLGDVAPITITGLNAKDAERIAVSLDVFDAQDKVASNGGKYAAITINKAKKRGGLVLIIQ